MEITEKGIYFNENEKDYIGINGVGIEQLIHPHFEIWHRWFIETYKPPKNKIGVFIPCAAIKPYYNSPIHKAFNKIIDKYSTHKLVISNAGIIPYEFAGCYPFDSYDWNPCMETEYIRNEYKKVVGAKLHNYIRKHENRYRRFIAYVQGVKKDIVLDTVKDVKVVDITTYNTGTKDKDIVLMSTRNLQKLDTLLKTL